MGRGQVVRQRVLVSLFGGSSPSVPDPFLSASTKQVNYLSLLWKKLEEELELKLNALAIDNI